MFEDFESYIVLKLLEFIFKPIMLFYANAQRCKLVLNSEWISSREFPKLFINLLVEILENWTSALLMLTTL